MKHPFVITIDKGASLPEASKNGALYAQNRDTLVAMDIGDSFFFEDATRDDVAGLIRYAKRHLVHLQAVEVESDEIYALPGVRVARVEQDELPGRKATKLAPIEDGKTHWINRKTNKRYTCEPGVKPEDAKAVQISKHEFDLEAHEDKPVLEVRTRYFHHPESDSVFETKDPEYFPDDGTCVEIEEAQYRVLKAEYELAATPTYWQDPKGPVVIEYLPGRRPDPKSGKVQVGLAEYRNYQNSTLPFTFWRKTDGTCVRVPQAKLAVALRTPGATQITVNEFNDWVKAQDDDEL